MQAALAGNWPVFFGVSETEKQDLFDEALGYFHELFTCMKIARNNSYATRVSGVGGATSTTVMLCTTTKVYGTLEEVVDLYVTNKSRMVLDFAKTQRLVHLANPSAEHPMRSAGLRWSTWKTISKFVRDRDLCYLEFMDQFVDKATGRRGWARCTKSIDHPSCPVSPLPDGPIRAELFCSGLIFQETYVPGVLELSTLVHVDTKNVPSWIGREVLKWRKKNALNLSHILKISRCMKYGLSRTHSGARLLDHNGRELRICRSCHDQISKWHRTRRCRSCHELLCKKCSSITYYETDSSGIPKKCNRLCTDCALSLEQPYRENDGEEDGTVTPRSEQSSNAKDYYNASVHSYYSEPAGGASLSSTDSSCGEAAIELIDQMHLDDDRTSQRVRPRQAYSRRTDTQLCDLSYLDSIVTK